MAAAVSQTEAPGTHPAPLRAGGRGDTYNRNIPHLCRLDAILVLRCSGHPVTSSSIMPLSLQSSDRDTKSMRGLIAKLVLLKVTFVYFFSHEEREVPVSILTGLMNC